MSSQLDPNRLDGGRVLKMEISHNIKELDFLLGKKVLVTTLTGEKVPGILQFVGTSELFPSWGLHCTVGRMPGLMINSVNDIELLEDLN